MSVSPGGGLQTGIARAAGETPFADLPEGVVAPQFELHSRLTRATRPSGRKPPLW